MLAVSAMVALVVLAMAPLSAEIAVLVTGDVLHIDSFALDGERMRLDLRGGGRLTLPLGRIERIVDDEIVRPPEQVQGSFSLDLAFRDEHPVPPVPYGELIYETAKRHGLNPELIAAMTRAESAWDKEAVSVKGARGLMQLMPATAARFGVDQSELFEPARNLEAGASYVKWLIGRFDGDLPLVLAGYNAGEGAVDRYDGIPPYRETQGYVARILGYLGFEPAVGAPASSG